MCIARRPILFSKMLAEIVRMALFEIGGRARRCSGEVYRQVHVRTTYGSCWQYSTLMANCVIGDRFAFWAWDDSAFDVGSMWSYLGRYCHGSDDLTTAKGSHGLGAKWPVMLTPPPHTCRRGGGGSRRQIYISWNAIFIYGELRSHLYNYKTIARLSTGK